MIISRLVRPLPAAVELCDAKEKDTDARLREWTAGHSFVRRKIETFGKMDENVLLTRGERRVVHRLVMHDWCAAGCEGHHKE